MNDTLRLQELFSLYQQRRCTAAEVTELIELLQQADAEAALSGPMQELWEDFRGHATEYPIDWDTMYSRVSRSEDDLYTLSRRPGRSPRLLYAVAAIMILALMIPAIWWLFSGHAGQRKEPVAAVQTAPKDKLTPVSELQKRRVLHLPDGSTVILNRNSRLDYIPGFTSAIREVYLTGEAFFDIVHVPGKPFLVHTGKVTTRVLGTSFNIKAYPSDKAIEITVEHGKVQVMDEKTNMGLLTDAQQLRFEVDKDQYKFGKVDVNAVAAWRPQEIRFDDITLSEIGRQIEQRFGRTVRFANPALENCRVTASFYEDDGLEEIMTVVCGISQSTWLAKENVIVIDGKGCN
ncbi:MAG: FecR domain-containing protein [Chitinophagaceae bacterium]|nr:FecR domain-containing protein [Chitinophagaceae bacterium]